MGRFLLISLLSMVLVMSVVDGQSCPARTCYFDDVAVIRPTRQEPNRNFVIGGLFDIRTKGTDRNVCGTQVTTEGIISQLAFLWGVNHYRETIQNNQVSVGAVAFDNCHRPEQTLENILGFGTCKFSIEGIQKENLVAYVGPYANQDFSRAASLSSDLGITLVSPTADAVDLGVLDSTLRLSPSFSYDLDAMVAFLDSMNADFAVVLYSESDAYGPAYMELIDKLNATSICVTYSANIDTKMNDLQSFVQKELATVVRQKYVIPLMSDDTLSRLLAVVAVEGDVAGKLRFLLNSHQGGDRSLLTQSANAATDAIVLTRGLPDTPELRQFNEFVTYIGNQTVDDLEVVDNPWLADFKVQNPNVLQSLNLTHGPQSDLAKRTLLSVRVIMKGMEEALNSCATSSNNYQFCDAYRNQASSANLLYNQFRNSYNIFSPNGGLQQRQITYNYQHFSNPGTGATLVQVGTYQLINGVGTATVNLAPTGPFSPPDCERKKQCCRQSTTPASSTVSSTSTAATNNGPVVEDFSVVRYRKGQAITGAFPVTSTQGERTEWGTRFDLGHSWVLALGVLAGVGILCVLVFEIYILYKLLGTRLGHKWRTMWLGQLLLFGIFLAYLVLFAYIFIPTKATCGITRFGVGVSYAICFAVLLVKLMVILTSKSSDVLLPGDESPNYLKGIYQFLMFIFAVGVQVVIDVQWLITVPPEAVKVKSNIGTEVWVCNHYTWEAGQGMWNMDSMVRTNFENHVLSLIYIMVMILITTVLSLNAHGIITNHRESVFIGIAAGFSIPIWLAWTLVGGLNADHDYAQEFGDACIAFGLFLTVTLILFAMFLPKVRQLVNMGVEGIYLEDDRDTYYAGSVIMAPPSYKSKGPSSVIYVNNQQGIYSEPVVIGNGDPSKEDATHLKHPGSTYSAPPTYLKRPESTYGGSKVLMVTDDLRGRHPQKRPQSEVAYGTAGRPRSVRGGTLTRSRSQELGAL